MQVALRIGEELRAAAGAAEVVVGAVVGGVVRGGCRVDGHAADRVDGLAVGMLVCGHARALRPAVSSSAGSVVSAAMIGQVSGGPGPGRAPPCRARDCRIGSTWPSALRKPSGFWQEQSGTPLLPQNNCQLTALNSLFPHN